MDPETGGRRKTEISAGLSRAETASRRRIFVRRQEIEADVFEKAKNKLVEYTKTADYGKSLEKSAALISEKLTGDDTVLLVREQDMKYKDKLFTAFGRSCEVKTSEDILIGGVIGVSKKLGLLADETLDSKLEEQHEWFCENSGLMVTE